MTFYHPIASGLLPMPIPISMQFNGKNYVRICKLIKAEPLAKN